MKGGDSFSWEDLCVNFILCFGRKQKLSELSVRKQRRLQIFPSLLGWRIYSSMPSLVLILMKLIDIQKWRSISIPSSLSLPQFFMGLIFHSRNSIWSSRLEQRNPQLGTFPVPGTDSVVDMAACMAANSLWLYHGADLFGLHPSPWYVLQALHFRLRQLNKCFHYHHGYNWYYYCHIWRQTK